MKRAISIILSIVMVFSVLPTSIFATENTAQASTYAAENSGFSGSNIAPMATLTLSESVEANYDPASSAATNIYNGNYEDSFARNATTLEGAEDYYQFNWEDSATVEGVRLYNQYSGQAPTAWKVFVSADGETQWTEVASISNVEWTEGNLEYKDIAFTRQTGIKGLRVQIVDANMDWGHYTIYELEIYGKVTVTGTLTTGTNTGNMDRIPYNNENLIVDLDGGWCSRFFFDDANGDGYMDLFMASNANNSPGLMVFYADENTKENYTYSKGYQLNTVKYWPLYPTYSYNEDGSLENTLVFYEGTAYPDFVNTFTNDAGINYAQNVTWPLLNEATYNRDQTYYSLVDYNGDGKRDLICGLFDRDAHGWDCAYDENGVWQNEQMHGWVMWAENTGTDDAPVFSGTANVVCINNDPNNPIDNFGKPSPSFADWDHDGDLDLLCGNFSNDITYYQNIGTATEPVYAPGTAPLVNGQAVQPELNGVLQSYDWDGDGWIDIIMAEEDGRVSLWKHTGTFTADGVPIVEDVRYLQQPADNLGTGAYSAPFSVDWDKDGDEDLFVTDTAGFFTYIENITIDGEYTYRGDMVASLTEDELTAQLVDPSWTAPVRLTDPNGDVIRITAGENGSIQGPGEKHWGYTALSMGDWDGDGDVDIVGNSIWGKVIWLENLNTQGSYKIDKMFSAPQTVQVNDETPAKPSWNWWDPEPYELVTQHRSTPFMIDWNEDGLQDLVMVDCEGYLAFYERNANGMVEPPTYPFGSYNGADKFQLNSQTRAWSGRVRMTMTDWDMDGDIDLFWFANSGSNVRYSENKGQDSNGIWRFEHHGEISDVYVGGHETSPTICDWNRDNVPDLIIGGGEAHYFYYVNPNEAPAEPETVSDYLMAHWDFEGTGDQVYADKATKDAIDDNLLSKNASNITIQNGIATITGNGALYANDSVELSPTQELTIYFRAYVGNDTTIAFDTTLIDKRSTSGIDTTVWPGVDKNTRSFAVYKEAKSAGDFFTVIGTTYGKETVLTTGAWRDYVFVISKDPTTGYLTQTLYQSTVARPASTANFAKKSSTTTTLTEILDTNVPLLIGNSMGLREIDVRIFDEVRLYNKALTIDELVQDLDLDQPCTHSDKEVTVISHGDSTHTVKEVCRICDEMLSEITSNCADSSDADAKCDVCGYEKALSFYDDFENLGKVWSVDPSHNNVFLTEGNDGTYDYMRLNAAVSGNKGGAHSYAIPVTAGETYTVQLTYKSSKYLTVYTYSRDNTDVIGGTPIHSSNRNIDKGTTSWITRSFDYTVADGATHMDLMVYFMSGNTPAYADFRSIIIKDKTTGEVVENFKLDRGWNYYTKPATDGTCSISYGQLNSYNSTNVVNFKTGSTGNGLRSPVIDVTAGETYYVSFGYSSHKNTAVQIEYWDANGVVYPQKYTVKTSMGGYNGFKNQFTVKTTVPEGYQYMTILFHDQYYNLFVDNVKVYQPLPCAHTDTASKAVSNNDGTHTVTVTCTCGEVVSTETAACADTNEDLMCDACGYELSASVAHIYVPETGIVNPPTVIQQVTTALPENTPAVAIVEIDTSLNILDASGNALSTVAAFAESYGSTVIPAYVVDSQEEATALAQYLNDNDVVDAYAVAESANAALVKSVRQTCGNVRGALIFDDLTTLSARQSARELVVNNMAYVAISKAALDADAIEYFNTRQIAVWSYICDASGVYGAIAAGYTGVISEDPATVYDVYESITDTTVSGKPVIIAHRGYAKEVPENTLASIQAAIDLGCQAVEIDLRISSDGVLVLDHDGILTRTTDYEERTDEFTKGQYTAAYTIEELKKLNVDYMGGTYQMATFEEVLAEFAGKVVLYCHINGDGKAAEYNWLTEEFNKLVEQYNAQDSVVYFSSYGYIDNVTAGVPIAVGQSGLTGLYASEDEHICVQNFISTLTPNNYQPLFYAYEGHQNDDFYYRLAARGFVSSHSVTDGQDALNSTLLTDCGAVGVLTNDPALTTEYSYQVLAEDATVATGENIDVTHNAAKILGVTEQVSCDFVQLSGPALAATDTGYAATEAGEITLVFYTTVTAPGGDSYRIYSQPVTYTVEKEYYDVLWNVALGDDLDLSFHVKVDDSIADKAYIHLTVAGGQVQSYKFADGEKDEAGYYTVTVPMAAAQMTDEITLQVTADGFEGEINTYCIAQYAESVLNDSSLSAYQALVKEMLCYGAAAQNYFGYNAENTIDESLYEGAGSQEISTEGVADVMISGNAEGIRFYGATLLFKSKTTVRFYFTAENAIGDYSFTADGEPLTATEKSGLYYVDVAGINPQDLDEAVTVTVNGTLNVSYSPMNYMVRMSQKGSDNLKALLKAMYNYHLAAKAFAERVVLSDFVEVPTGKQNLALTATASAQVDATLGNSAAQLNEGDRTWSLSRPAESLEGQTDYYYLTWNEAVSFGQVVLFNQFSGQAPTAWNIAVTTDGESWKEIASAENVTWSEDQLEGKALTFPQQENIIGLRLQIVDANLIWGAYTIYEVEVY